MISSPVSASEPQSIKQATMFGYNSLKKFNADLIGKNTQLVAAVKSLQNSNISDALSQIRTMIFPNWQSIREIDAYIIFDDVYTVVSRWATICAQVPLVGYNDVSEEDLPKTDELSKYLKTLTLQEKETLFTFLGLTGEVFLWKDRVTLGPNKGKLKTYFLHPSFMTVIQEEAFPYKIIGYRYQDTRATFTLAADEVIFIKYFNPTTRYDERHRGMSAIKALAQRLTRLQANMSGSVSMQQNGGTPVIVYDKTPGMDTSSNNGEVTVMGQHKDNFGRFIRNSDNKGAPYFAAGEMGVLPLGLTSVELESLKQADVDFDKICNAYSMPATEFNKSAASTESNVKEMRVAMYTNAVIPNITRVCDGVSAGVVDVFGENKCIRGDYSKVVVLQENQKDKAAAWAAMPAIVINEMRLAFGQDKSTDPMADVLLVKTGYALADDLNINVQPIDNTANDYGATN